MSELPVTTQPENLDAVDPVVGDFRVEFTNLLGDGEVDSRPMNIPLGDYARHIQTRESSAEGERVRELIVGPWIVEGKPYEGPLRASELAWVKSLPSKKFNPHWRFAVTPIPAAKEKV